jgi:hypothetical protein
MLKTLAMMGLQIIFDFQFEDSKEDEFSTINGYRYISDTRTNRYWTSTNDWRSTRDSITSRGPIEENTQFEAGYRGTPWWH